MRIGIVCPYSFDAPGGVQAHVAELAAQLGGRGHTARVLAPAEEGTDLPEVVEAAGASLAIPYNGSVARLTFSPASAAHVRRWLTDGAFDVVHVHEPIVPSLSRQAADAAQVPVVATFHASLERSRALEIAGPLLVPVLDKISGRIAVSEEARRTLAGYAEGDAIVIPNGVDVGRFVAAAPRPAWQGTPEAPTIAFLGRLDEPRKGLLILVRAYLRLLDEIPGARLLVAGRGDASEARGLLAADPRRPVDTGAVSFLGGVSEEDKAALLSSVDVYVAPQTGGESFGIVLVEAMAAGTLVVASDLAAFRAVLDEGRRGRHFAVGDDADLARTVAEVLRACPDELLDAAAREVWHYDWGTVTDRILAVYETVLLAAGLEVPGPGARTRVGRLDRFDRLPAVRRWGALTRRLMRGGTR